MTVVEAVKKSKSYVNELFGPEGISDLGLEEVEYDDSSNSWLVTLGFNRPWVDQLEKKISEMSMPLLPSG